MKRVLTVFSVPLFCVSLLISTANAADIVWVHQNRGQEGEGTGDTPAAGEGSLAWEDDQWRALLEGAGHNIIAHDRFDDLDIAPEGLDILNSGDIVIFSRDSNSGDYNEPDEQDAWAEGVTVPMIILTPYVIRSNRWDMVDATGIQETNKDDGIGNLEPVDPTHPLFVGALDAQGTADVWDEEALGPDDNIDFLNVIDDDGKVGNGTVLAYEPDFELPWIIHWEAGVEYYEDSVLGYTAPAERLYYSVGSDDDPFSWGEKNTTAAGDQILLNAITWMTGGGGLQGDFNGNGELDAGDIDALTAESAAGTNNTSFDITGDGTVDAADVTLWATGLKNTWLGDANLDGEFNSSDFVGVFSAGLFETNQPANWSSGDWNGDGVFSSGDFVAAFSDGGFEIGPRPQAATVPEPTGLVTLVLTGLCLIRRKR